MPYCFNLTSLFGACLTLSIGLSIGSLVLSVARRRESFVELLIPSGCPLIIAAAVIAVEVLGLLARSQAMGVRLAANMVAGHTLLALLSGVGDAWIAVVVTSVDVL